MFYIFPLYSDEASECWGRQGPEKGQTPYLAPSFRGQAQEVDELTPQPVEIWGSQRRCRQAVSKEVKSTHFPAAHWSSLNKRKQGWGGVGEPGIRRLLGSKSWEGLGEGVRG